MAKFYDLDGCEISYEKWSEIFKGRDRFLAGDRVREKKLRVSTVWIGLAWLLEGEQGENPLIFETMVFGEDDGDFEDLGCWRWATREQALEGHQKIVDGLRSGMLVLDTTELDD